MAGLRRIEPPVPMPPAAPERRRVEPDVTPPFVPIRRAVEMTGLSRRTLWRLVDQSVLKGYRIGNRRYLSTASIRRFVEERE